MHRYASIATAFAFGYFFTLGLLTSAGSPCTSRSRSRPRPAWPPSAPCSRPSRASRGSAASSVADARPVRRLLLPADVGRRASSGRCGSASTCRRTASRARWWRPIDARWLSDDPASLARIPDGLRVHRVRFRGPGNRVLPADRLAAATGPLDRALVRARLAPQRAAAARRRRAVAGRPVPAATRLLRSGRFDALLTTSPPHSVTVGGRHPRPAHGPAVGGRLARPLARAPRRGARPPRRCAPSWPPSARLARRVAPRMAGAACVNEAIADEVRQPGARRARSR